MHVKRAFCGRAAAHQLQPPASDSYPWMTWRAFRTKPQHTAH